MPKTYVQLDPLQSDCEHRHAAELLNLQEFSATIQTSDERHHPANDHNIPAL